MAVSDGEWAAETLHAKHPPRVLQTGVQANNRTGTYEDRAHTAPLLPWEIFKLTKKPHCARAKWFSTKTASQFALNLVPQT